MDRSADSGLTNQSSGRSPSWCEWNSGATSLLFVAPHGGRRPSFDAAAPPPHLRVNDLYTPEVTRALANVLHAGCVINHGMDRNALDLNRISQVRRRAVWFLEGLAHEIGRILDRHEEAEVVFVHGWNTGQPKCDIGIGAAETGGDLRLPDGAHLTVSEAYLEGRISRLRDACAQAMIRATIGERYPASHRNNVLQLFTPGPCQIDDPAAQRIAAWVGEGRLNALQLELGIPLRWPGVWRDRFIEAMVGVFGGSRKSKVESLTVEHRTQSTREGRGDACVAPTARRHAVGSAALQFYDPVVDVGMFAGIGRLGPRVLAGRLLLFLGGQRVALFTGEEANAEETAIVPLRFFRDDEVMRVEFHGPMLLLEDARLYTDLEAALAASQAIEGTVELEFRPLHPSADGSPQFGRVSGEVTVPSRLCRVHAGGFANAGGFRAAGTHSQTMLAAAFGTQRAVLSRTAGAEGGVGLLFAEGATQPLQRLRMEVCTDGDPYTPATFELTSDAQLPLYGQTRSRMGILRPAANGQYLRVTFGVARFQWGDREGHGLYEHARLVSPGHEGLGA